MAKTIRDNLVLLAFVVVLVGTSSTEAYYASFGLRYQYLSLSGDHILVRGLTAGFANPVVWLLYVISIALLASQARLTLFVGGLTRARYVGYTASLLLIAAAWAAGAAGGRAAALADGTEGRSTLPKVIRLDVKQGRGVAGPMEGERLLMQSGAGLFLVRPVRDRSTKAPLVRFVPGGNVDGLSLCSDC